jgi:hypothetical protein
MKLRLLVDDGSGWMRRPAPAGLSDTSSSRDYNRDLYECTREATFAGHDNRKQVFDDCMKARGYKEKSSSK